MEIQAVLANNVAALMTASGMTENAFAQHHKLPKSNLRKMRLEESNMRIGTVADVAKQLRLRACDLLDPDLAARARAGAPLRMAEPRPPVMAEEQWRALSPRARAFVEDLCQQAAAGTVTDADIGWLHDGLNRAARHVNTENTATPAVTGIAAEVLSKKLTTESTEIRPGRVAS